MNYPNLMTPEEMTLCEAIDIDSSTALRKFLVNSQILVGAILGECVRSKAFRHTKLHELGIGDGLLNAFSILSRWCANHPTDAAYDQTRDWCGMAAVVLLAEYGEDFDGKVANAQRYLMDKFSIEEV